MKSDRNTILILLLLLLNMASCVKDKAEDMAEAATTFEDINVPADFDYSSTKTVTIAVKVNDPEMLTMYRYIVKIYDEAPAEGGKLLITGSLNTEDYTYSPTITVPKNTVQVWVEIYLGNKLVQQGNHSL